MFGVSVLILIVDKISMSSTQKSVSLKTQTKKITNNTDLNYSKNNEIVISQSFTDVSEDVLLLKGWERNPFIKSRSTSPSQSQGVSNPKKKVPVNLSELDNIKITSVFEIGDDSVISIDGKIYREGDLINNMIIDSIDRQKITLKLNDLKYVIYIGS